MVRIAPWAAAVAMMAGAERALGPGDISYLHGPFQENGVHTAPSNAAFDVSLRSRNPDWGVRELGDVTALAMGHGLELVARFQMPANNLSLVFRRSGPSQLETKWTGEPLV